MFLGIRIIGEMARMHTSKSYLTLIIIFFSLFNNNLVNGQDLYKTSLVRASPGDLLELIGIYKQKAIKMEEITGFKPYILRHSQGDNWDLMVIEYIKDYHSYFKEDDKATSTFVPAFGERGTELIAYHEEFFVKGPDYNSLMAQFNENGYYHVEMFISLSGKHQELFDERKMENEYLKFLKRPLNFIFARDLGGRWDLFTIGAYRDLTHYAGSALIPEEKEDEAAKQAGFESAGTIGSYLRSLILEHHDTLATKIN